MDKNKPTNEEKKMVVTKVLHIPFNKVNNAYWDDECDYCERQLGSRVAWECDMGERLLVICNSCMMKELNGYAKQ